jgi:C4-dicarboxylate-specific signal transduction histidine kinase
MNDAKDTILRRKGFGFFGAITASLSHEINNVFAIINELSGLMDDFFVASQQGAPLNVDRLKGTTERISVQVKRGQEYVKRLNRFAHTVDDKQVGMMNVGPTAEAITTLCQRFGVLRKVEFESSFPPDSCTIEGSPFDLQHIIFRCIDIILNVSKQGDSVRIDVQSHEDGARLVFESASPLEAGTQLETERDFLALLASEMHGVVDSKIKAGQPVRLEVSLPQSSNNPRKSS